jgi:hypothetical protein
MLNLSLKDIIFFSEAVDVSIVKNLSTNETNGILIKDLSVRSRIEIDELTLNSFIKEFEATNETREQIVIRISYNQDPLLNFRAEFIKKADVYTIFMRNITQNDMKEKLKEYIKIEQEKKLLEQHLDKGLNSSNKVKI